MKETDYNNQLSFSSPVSPSPGSPRLKYGSTTKSMGPTSSLMNIIEDVNMVQIDKVDEVIEEHFDNPRYCI